MSVIGNAKLKYAYYKSQILTGKKVSLKSNFEIDLEISLKAKNDNLAYDFSFNIIYWGSPLIENKSGKEKISYVLNVLKLADILSPSTFSIPFFNKDFNWDEYKTEN